MAPPNLWLIPGLPLAAAVITALLGPRLLRRQSHWPCILGVVGAGVLSFLVMIDVVRGGLPVVDHVTWFAAGDVSLHFNLRADGLTAVMLVTVTFVSSLIAIFSIGY